MQPVLSLMIGALLALADDGQATVSPKRPVHYRVPGAGTVSDIDVLEIVSPARIHVGGWLGERIAVNEKERLLKVDTEPLLAGYRKKPGSHPWIGEHIGKWLHAATLAWAGSGDPALRAKLDGVVKELVACQEPDGYLGTYVPEKRFGLFPAADWDVWSHKYNLIGLLTYYKYTGDPHALEACRKMADLLIATFPGKKSILAAGTHVGMAATSVLEPIVLLYRYTADDRYLAFARYIVRSWDEPGGPGILTALKAGKGVQHTANAKAYEMLSNLVGLCELARATGDRGLLIPVVKAWDDIVANRLYVTGSASAGEHFRADHLLPNDSRANVGETCVTTTWIQLNLQLLRLLGDGKFGDELERSFYNHLSAAQHPRGDDWCYYTALEGTKHYDAGINCCHSSGPRGMALAVQAAYLKDHASGGLFVNTLETSRFETELDGQTVRLEQASTFPRKGSSTITVYLARPAAFPLAIRVPAWSTGFKATVNGAPVEAGVSGGAVRIGPRQWHDGDQVTISYGLNPRMILGTHGNAGRAALAWGPFVLAYEPARSGAQPPVGIASLVAREPLLLLLPGHALAFRGTVVGRDGTGEKSVSFVPFADAGASGGAYRVWVRAPGNPLPARSSILTEGEESRSREGNQPGSIRDGDASSFVVTYDGKRAEEDWYAVTLPGSSRVARVVFRHGRLFHDGGWFDASRGKPRVQVQRTKGGGWETVAELASYPATTAADAGPLKDGDAFEATLDPAVDVRAVRVVGAPASGDSPSQAFSSCGELEAYDR